VPYKSIIVVALCMQNNGSVNRKDAGKWSAPGGNRFFGDLRFRHFLIACVFLPAMVFSNGTAYSQVMLDVELGVVITGYNDVRIPGNTGTLFSLKDDLTPEPALFLRLRGGYTIQNRHHISLLYSPLKIQSHGELDDETNFQGVMFPAGQPVTAVYRFNSYRLTYRYMIVDNPKFRFGLGLTAKIRHADISLASDGQFANKPDLGFVPIINFHLHWQRWERFGFLLEGDALAAPQGRAEDVFLGAVYALSDHITFRGGYRILEGGADNSAVYTFSMFHYAALGINYRINPSSNRPKQESL